MIFKRFLLIILIAVNLKAVCPPCHCTDASSVNGEISLVSIQAMILSKVMAPTLVEILKETMELKKEEKKNLELTKKLVAYEYYKTLKLKEILKNVQKQRNLLYLKLKAVQNLANQQMLKNKIFLYEIKQNKK